LSFSIGTFHFQCYPSRINEIIYILFYFFFQPDEVPLEESVVVAKYIEKPLLVEGHKCDLRLYVVVTSYDPLIIYMYEEGLVRFATVKYDSGRKHLWNPCMHLCNYSINKHHSDYIK
jgi:Tubulin-tyrosine ligase family.